jgi:hypothetical protein
VDQIVGSVNRYQDFDRVFLPTQAHTAHRWRSISRAFYDDVSLPPVKLYKVGDTYFVMDGNHRVSVARERGQLFLDAEVIEARTRVPVEADLNADDLEIMEEYVEFLERTRLDEMRPGQRITFTIGGGYQRLLEHIAVHRYFMGLEEARFIPKAEAVCDWYDNLYLPLVHTHHRREGYPEPVPKPNRGRSLSVDHGPPALSAGAIRRGGQDGEGSRALFQPVLDPIPSPNSTRATPLTDWPKGRFRRA